MILKLSTFFIENSYMIFVTLLFLGVYLFSQYKIKRVEKKRLKSIRKRDISDAVETDSPIENQESALKKKGIGEIEDKFSFLRKMFPIVLFIFWSIAIAIPYIGRIPSVYISIVAAIISVIAGFSLRPFLENLFSGVVISFFKSIKIGDTVTIDDQYGIIEEIGLTYSILRRWDWNRIIIPNTKLLQKEIQNLTMTDHYIWAHVEFFVSPDTDISELEIMTKNIAKDSKYFNDAEEPSFWVMSLEKDTIKCWLAAWADNPSDAWELRNDMRTKLIKEFQKRGIKFHQHILNSI